MGTRRPSRVANCLQQRRDLSSVPLSSEDGTLQHNLYDVKQPSVILELLIVDLTLKTIPTGFGAR